jgi:hypothetical protein
LLYGEFRSEPTSEIEEDFDRHAELAKELAANILGGIMSIRFIAASASAVTLSLSSVSGALAATELQWWHAMAGANCPSSNELRLFGLWKIGVSGSVCGLI